MNKDQGNQELDTKDSIMSNPIASDEKPSHTRSVERHGRDWSFSLRKPPPPGHSTERSRETIILEPSLPQLNTPKSNFQLNTPRFKQVDVFKKSVFKGLQTNDATASTGRRKLVEVEAFSSGQKGVDDLNKSLRGITLANRRKLRSVDSSDPSSSMTQDSSRGRNAKPLANSGKQRSLDSLESTPRKQNKLQPKPMLVTQKPMSGTQKPMSGTNFITQNPPQRSMDILQAENENKNRLNRSQPDIKLTKTAQQRVRQSVQSGNDSSRELFIPSPEPLGSTTTKQYTIETLETGLETLENGQYETKDLNTSLPSPEIEMMPSKRNKLKAKFKPKMKMLKEVKTSQAKISQKTQRTRKKQKHHAINSDEKTEEETIHDEYKAAIGMFKLHERANHSIKFCSMVKPELDKIQDSLKQKLQHDSQAHKKHFVSPEDSLEQQINSIKEYVGLTVPHAKNQKIESKIDSILWSLMQDEENHDYVMQILELMHDIIANSTHVQTESDGSTELLENILAHPDDFQQPSKIQAAVQILTATFHNSIKTVSFNAGGTLDKCWKALILLLDVSMVNRSQFVINQVQADREANLSRVDKIKFEAEQLLAVWNLQNTAVQLENAKLKGQIQRVIKDKERMSLELNQQEDLMRSLYAPADQDELNKLMQDVTALLEDQEEMHAKNAHVLQEIGTMINHEWVDTIEAEKPVQFDQPENKRNSYRRKTTKRTYIDFKQTPLTEQQITSCESAISNFYDNEDEGMLMPVFKMFDTSGDGKISRDEFQTVMLSVNGSGGNEKKIDELFDEFDEDGSGELDFSEFSKVMKETLTMEDRLQPFKCPNFNIFPAEYWGKQVVVKKAKEKLNNGFKKLAGEEADERLLTPPPLRKFIDPVMPLFMQKRCQDLAEELLASDEKIKCSIGYKIDPKAKAETANVASQTLPSKTVRTKDDFAQTDNVKVERLGTRKETKQKTPVKTRSRKTQTKESSVGQAQAQKQSKGQKSSTHTPIEAFRTEDLTPDASIVDSDDLSSGEAQQDSPQRSILKTPVNLLKHNISIPKFKSLVEFCNDETPMTDLNVYRLFENVCDEKAKFDFSEDAINKHTNSLPIFLVEFLFMQYGLKKLAFKHLGGFMNSLSLIAEKQSPYGLLICQLLNVYSNNQIPDRLVAFILRARYEFVEIQTRYGGNNPSREVLEVGGHAPYIEIMDILPNLFGDRKEL